MNLLTETDLQASRANLQLPVHTAVFKMDNQQGPPAQHREVCSMLHGSLDGRGVWGRMDTCICMTESLWSPPATVTTLLTGYIHQYKIKRSFLKISLEKKEALNWHSMRWNIHYHAESTQEAPSSWKPYHTLSGQLPCPMPRWGLDSSVTATQTPWLKTLHHPCLHPTLYLEWTPHLVAFAV